jgi:hypothetical protein
MDNNIATENDIEVLKQMYDCFNARDIDGVLGALTDAPKRTNAPCKLISTR